jgi:hypothetical protein
MSRYIVLEEVPHLVVLPRASSGRPSMVALQPPQARFQRQELSQLQLSRSAHTRRVVGPSICCLVVIRPPI